jgi:hypothetical protein
MPVNNKIKIRRGNNIDLPSGGTESGELRYSIDTKELYIDDGSLNIKIGGDPYAFPISTATQTALDGKQLIGTYATGTGTANGTNTGDETLTTIKTKLGAATSVSDGYLKYQDWSIFNSKEPAITKKSGFNLPLGTTTGTVLEGRTFGTAAGSAVGDFQPKVPVQSFGCVIGNSTVASYLGQNSIASYLISSSELKIGTHVTDLSFPGSTIAAQKSLWESDANKLNYDWILCEIGLNDLAPSEEPETALGRYQDLINTINSQKKSSAIIIISCMTPCKQRLLNVYGSVDGLTSYQKWIEMNDAIMGIGANAITGVSGRVNSHVPILNDDGDLNLIYDMGDGVHENNLARQIIANEWMKQLNNHGYLTSSTTYSTPYKSSNISDLNDISTTYFPVKNGVKFENSILQSGTNKLICSGGIDITGNINNTGAIVSNSLTTPSSGFALIGENYFYRYDATTMGLSGDFKTNGAATFGGNVTSGGFLLNGVNLTSNLYSEYISRWNGLNFESSIIKDVSTFTGNKIRLGNSSVEFINTDLSAYIPFTFYSSNYRFADNGYVSVLSTTPSTSPTNGALVVGGGVGADHVRANNFYGNGSNLTGVQLPITLTTNGTSGAATFSGNVLNVPNYAASGGVNQTQTTVNGSTGGNMVCSMPFQTGSYKKVMIRFSSLSGNASYSYPTVFTTQPSISSIYQQAGNPGTYTTGGAGASAFTITGASGMSGWIFIEGY